MADALDRAVVQITMRHFEHRGQILFGNREAVVLRRDLDPAGVEVLHRLVRAAVAELELERRGPASQRQQLMTETNAENRRLPQQAADGFDRIAQRLGIARPVG